MVAEDSRLEEYKWIWTSHAEEFYLARLASSQEHVIVRISKGPPITSGCLIIEDNEIYAKVKQKMLEEGIKVIDLEEYNRLRGR